MTIHQDIAKIATSRRRSRAPALIAAWIERRQTRRAIVRLRDLSDHLRADIGLSPDGHLAPGDGDPARLRRRPERLK